MLMAGKAPFTTRGELLGTRDTYVHFVQEPFDQASLVRPYLKWEWTLPSGIVVKEALRRAHSIMQSEPQGPVYLMMQRETLTQPWSVDDVRRFDAEQHGATTGGGADPKLVTQLVDRLLTAKSPILITGYAGRNPRASELITELAEFAGIGVFESNMTNNISHDSPCFLGFAPDKHLPNADVGLLVDVDVPWFPSDVEANANTFWAHIDVDILKPASPMWTFPGHLRMQGSSARILEQVVGELKARATPAPRPRRGGSRSSPPSVMPALSAPESSPPTRASATRSIRTTCSRSSASCWRPKTWSSTKASVMRARP
jgi:acetolactate synthase-1/2/3 large subunit